MEQTNTTNQFFNAGTGLEWEATNDYNQAVKEKMEYYRILVAEYDKSLQPYKNYDALLNSKKAELQTHLENSEAVKTHDEQKKAEKAEKRRAYMRKWSEKNKEKIHNYAQTYKEKHADELCEKAKKYRTENEAKVKAYKRKHYYKKKLEQIHELVGVQLDAIATCDAQVFV